jgi:hypothetical protein
MRDTFVIEPRFRGPPDSGNGGYSCGLLGSMIDGAAEVTLRKPPPLGSPLTIERSPDGTLSASHNGSIVIEARPASLETGASGTVSLAEAEEAAQRYEGFDNHAFPMCFVCGPERAEGEGLRIFPGELDAGACAAPWTPPDSDAGEDGFVRPEIVWAALDCPTGWATYYAAPDAGLSLLGRMTARILRPVEQGKTYVVAAWSDGEDGRKRFARGAILSEESEPIAVSRTVWIELRA